LQRRLRRHRLRTPQRTTATRGTCWEASRTDRACACSRMAFATKETGCGVSWLDMVWPQKPTDSSVLVFVFVCLRGC
jgi:hypothetical protein